METLSPQTVPALSHALTVAPHETEPVILQALAMIGDERAIPAVEQLLKRATHPEIRAAATGLLSILQQRARDNQAFSLLLRASNAPADAGQTLLRPLLGAVHGRPLSTPASGGPSKERRSDR